MRGAIFDPREVEAERHVIGEERARDLDSPFGRLDQTHLALAYLRHPYRNPILGWPDDLAGITVDDLRAFYGRHYRPDGAVLVIVGDVDPERAFDAVAAHFGAIPPGPAAAGARLDRAAADGPARVHAGRVASRWPGACSAGTPCPAVIPTARRSTSSPTC